MICFCCGRDVPVGRKVKVRRLVDLDPAHGPESAGYAAYLEETAYRWGVVCPGCYHALDNFGGGESIGGQFFTMAGQSRADKARTLTEDQYRDWQRAEAAKLGLDLPEGDGGG